MLGVCSSMAAVEFNGPTEYSQQLTTLNVAGTRARSHLVFVDDRSSGFYSLSRSRQSGTERLDFLAEMR
jgi:hypothetical protein